MPLQSDRTFYDVEVVLLTSVMVCFGLFLLVRRLRRASPDLDIGLPVAAAVVMRGLAAVGLSLTSFGATLRGGDEVGFAETGQILADQPFLSADNLANLTSDLHVWLFGLQARLLDSPEFAMRLVQIGVAVAGLTLMAAAVHELAGRRASFLAAWLLALEPAGVFFSSLLHKEPNMFLAGGLVVYGGARMWNRGEVRALLPLSTGCLIAITTRPYAGWFLITAGALITLHAAAKRPQLGSVALVAVVALVAALFVVPFANDATSEGSLEKNLQVSQDANTRDNASLRLEQVDYSTREDVVLNLPTRVRDVLFRPYPWQLGNLEQRFGLIGSLGMLAVLWLLGPSLWRRRGQIMSRAGPLVYVGLMLLFAYSLSAGNAGTGFRYRTHVVALAICALLALRSQAAAHVVAPGQSPAAVYPVAPPALANGRGRL